LSSFAIDKDDGIRVIGVHTHRKKPHTTEKAPMNHKIVD
jgi:hypothetical protein